MKNNIKYIKLIGIFVLALMVVSCNEFAEFDSESYGPGPTISLAQVSIQDSTFTVSVTSSADGFASVILLPGSGNTPPADPDDLLTGNVDAMDYQTKAVTGSTATNFTFSGLVQYASYEVMAAANNADGKPSEVSTLAVGTDDTHAPLLTSTSPTVGPDPVVEVDGSVVLVFDEAVVYDDTKDLVFTELNDGTDVVAGSVTVDFNEVTVTFGEDLTNRDFIILSYPEGAFTDHSGNLALEMDSYYDAVEDEIIGLYWRAVAMDFEAVSISPEDDVVPTAFDIVVTFAEEVELTDPDDDPYIEDGDITLTYDDGTDLFIKSVLASEVTATGNDLTITQSHSAGPGVEVTVNIPENLFRVGYGNPNAEVTASWIIELALSDLVGVYGVAAASLGSPGAWDEVWTATVELVPGNDTALSITIDAGGGGGIPFLAGFNVETLTVVIPAGTDAGDLYGNGTSAIYGSDYDNYLGGAVYGTITGASSFAIDELGMYMADPAELWLWDAFNTTWTKSAKKGAVSGSVPASKFERSK